MTPVNIMRKTFRTFCISSALLIFSTTAAMAQIAVPTSPTVGSTLKIVTPSEGQTIYGNRVPILFLIENFQLTDYQTNKKPVVGQSHIHLWLDEQNPTPESAVKLIKDEFTYNDVPYGEHTLRAELVNNDHTSLKPPAVVVSKFKNAAVSSPTPVVTSGFDKNTALVILVVVALVIVAAWWYTKEEEEPIKQESKSKVESRKSKARKTRKTARRKSSRP